MKKAGNSCNLLGIRIICMQTNRSISSRSWTQYAVVLPSAFVLISSTCLLESSHKMNATSHMTLSAVCSRSRCRQKRRDRVLFPKGTRITLLSESWILWRVQNVAIFSTRLVHENRQSSVLVMYTAVAFRRHMRFKLHTRLELYHIRRVHMSVAC